MNSEPIERRITRCAIYTRKSTEYGLDKAVNSLDAQREVCRAYIKCQAHRNWIEVPRRYDDGGYSGGTLIRPALNRLVADIEGGTVDMVVIYKIDRLTRSLLDFVRLIDVLERYGVSFVSVTQSFDTSDSMGRLVLNVLLTFAQFERELMSDRVRDNKAAMRKKGLFAGGLPPFGYLVNRGGGLVIDKDRAAIVTELFQRYPETGSVRELVRDLNRRGCVTRRWTHLLNGPLPLAGNSSGNCLGFRPGSDNMSNSDNIMRTAWGIKTELIVQQRSAGIGTGCAKSKRAIWRSPARKARQQCWRAFPLRAPVGQNARPV
jgi:DNA invertase Pin-like site-specific DNA recombinase